MLQIILVTFDIKLNGPLICYMPFPGLTNVSVNNYVSAGKVRAVKLGPGVEDREIVFSFSLASKCMLNWICT